MPNWTNNVVELAHGDPAMLERAKSAFNRSELLAEFIPVPADLNIVSGNVGPKGSPEQLSLEAIEKRNQEVYGYKNWYDFCVNEWGTKWDACAEGYEVEIEGGRLTLAFDSAWSPPIAAYEKLVALGFDVRAYYYEPGMAFCGTWEDGNDEFYDISNETADGIESMIPSDLDTMFCISETVREYEEEQEEEELHTWVVEGAEAKAKSE